MLFVACCLLPVAYVLTAPLGSFNSDLRGVWLDARQQGLLWNTARLGVGTALLATAIGAPLGLALARIAFRGKSLLRYLLGCLHQFAKSGFKRDPLDPQAGDERGKERRRRDDEDEGAVPSH